MLKYTSVGLDFNDTRPVYTLSISSIVEMEPPQVFSMRPIHVAMVLDCREERNRGLVLGTELFNNGIRVSSGDTDLSEVLTEIAQNNQYNPGVIYSLGKGDRFHR